MGIPARICVDYLCAVLGIGSGILIRDRKLAPRAPYVFYRAVVPENPCDQEPGACDRIEGRRGGAFRDFLAHPALYGAAGFCQGWRHFRNFFLSVIKEQATKALSYLEEEKVEDNLSPKQYEVWKHVSSVGEAAPGEIVKATGIALGTVRQALNSLVELGKVKRVGRGRGTRYVKL